MQPLIRLRLFIFLSIILFVCYSNTFRVTWQLDDKPNILNNRPIQITALSAEQLWQSIHARPGSGALHRPIAFLTLALNWYFGQNDVFGYHLVNLLIHIGAAWSLFLAICALFQTPVLRLRYSEEDAFYIAGLAALLWAINPIQTQAVTYIVQRMTSLAAFFSILALLCYLKGRIETSSLLRRKLFWGCAVLFYGFALLTKENTALLFLMVPVIEVLFIKIDFKSRHFSTIGLSLLLGSALSLTIISFLRPETFDFILHYYRNRPFTMVERLLTEQRILLYYLSLIFFPAPGRLSVDHDIVLSTSLFSPYTTAMAVAGNIMIIFISLRLYRRMPLVTFAVLFYYLNHIVESTIVPLELLFEHRNYLPSLFLFLPVAQGIYFLRNRTASKPAAIALHLFLAVIVAGLGYWTYTRNTVWRTEQSLWLDAAAKAPNSARPLAQLAILLAWGDNPNELKYRKALELTERTLSLRMGRRRLDAAQIANMASIHNKLGDYDTAAAYYEKALAVAPEDAKNRFNFVKNFMMKGDFEAAKREIATLFELGYIHSDYYHVLGIVELWLGEPEAALNFLHKALRRSPGRPDVLLAIGCCMSDLSYFDKAMWFFNRAKERGGEDMIVLLAMMQNELRRNQIETAKRIWSRMIGRYPLPLVLRHLHSSKVHYLTVPLDRSVLKPFAERQLGSLNTSLLP